LTIQKTAVFISSRFAEFATLRQLLAAKINAVGSMRLHAIQLDDNGAGDQPPSDLCVELIKHSEVVVLLLGDSYGPLAAGHEVSHTHLEYRASQDSESDARVLPYFICAGATHDDSLEAFRQEVLRNHRPGMHARPENDANWDALAGTIFNNLMNTLLELRFQEPGQGEDEDEEADGASASLPDAELASMLTPPVIHSVQDALSQPRALEAFEQMREAHFALGIGERSIAERHLRRAVDLRPLYPAAAEWLARVLVSSGRKKSALEAIALADRAARVYIGTDEIQRAAGALVLAARASSEHNREQAIAYARAAVEQAGWYAQTHFELARQLSMDSQGSAALASLERAFNCHPPIIEGVYNDLAFEGNRAAVDGFIRDMHQRVGSVITGVQASEAEMIRRLGLVARNSRDLSADARLWRRVYACRDAVRRQMRDLQNLAIEYLAAVAMNAPNDAALPVYSLDAASLNLHAQDGVEISFKAAAGAQLEKGQPVFLYRSANSRISRTWYAPVAMRLIWSTRATSLRGSDDVLTWSPVHQYTPAAQHRTRMAEERHALAQGRQQHADLSQQKTGVKRKLIAGVATVCASAAAAYFMRSESVVSVLLGIGTLYGAHVSNQLRQQYAALRDAIARCNLRCAGNEQQIAEEQRILNALQGIQDDRLSLLREMVALFESRALSLVSVSMPFQGLRSARVGDWVVVALSTAKEYAASFGVSLLVKDFADLPTQRGELSLMRVTQRDSSQITLERAAAYLPKQQS
jgi:tetratricopeptide (TPR) repeat protein